MSQAETGHPSPVVLAKPQAVQDLSDQDIAKLNPRAYLIGLAQTQIAEIQPRIDHQRRSIKVFEREALTIQQACPHQRTTLLKSNLPQLLATSQERVYLGESRGLCLDCGSDSVICCPSCGQHRMRYHDTIMFAGRIQDTESICERIDRLDEAGVMSVVTLDTEPGQCFSSHCTDCHISWYWRDQVDRDWSH